MDFLITKDLIADMYTKNEIALYLLHCLLLWNNKLALIICFLKEHLTPSANNKENVQLGKHATSRWHI